jgi:PAS domain S-box-containing protein
MPETPEKNSEAKQKLLLGEKRFRTVLESLPGAVFVHDLDGRLVFANEVATRDSGYSKEELLGMRVVDLDPKSPQREDRERLWLTLSQGESDSLETVLHRKDGTTYPAEVHLSSIKLDDQPVIVATTFDITRRKEVEGERRSYLHFFESMDRVNRAMQGAYDIDRMLSDVLDVAVSIFSCDRAFLLFPCDPEASSWSLPVERTRPEFPGLFAEGKRELMDPNVRMVLQIALDTTGATRFCPGTPYRVPEDTWEKYGFKSQMVFALHPKVGKPWLFGLHQCGHERIWAAGDEKLLEEVGRRLEEAITTMLIFRDLRESEDRLSEAQRVAHLGHWECDLDGGIVTHSNEALRIYGLPLEKRTTEMPVWNKRWLELVHPEDRARMARVAEETARGIAHEDVVYRILRPDGEVRIIQGVGEKKWSGSGRSNRMFGAIQDITERKRSEELVREKETFIRKILDSVDEGFIVVDRGFRIVSANKTFCDMAEISEAEAVGRLCHEVSHHAPKPCFELGEACPVKLTFETGKVQVASHIHINSNGARHHTELKAFPVTDDAGNVVSVIEILNDVTEKRKLEAQLHQSQKMESIGRLAGGVAHDFNNMLGVIIGRADMLLNHFKTDDPLFLSLQEIRKAAMRSAELTRQLLGFARKQAISPRVLDLNETVAGMLRMLRRLIGEEIELVWLPGQGMLRVLMDPTQLDQILANLCVNARDAISENGRVTIETGMATLEPGYCADHPGFVPGDFVVLSVSDDGHGMDKEILAKIFEPFFTTKEAHKGTGLGLATVYGIVKQNNGFVNVYSEPEFGTIFKLYLPVCSSGLSEEAGEAASPPPVLQGSETVLVVEDEIPMLEMTRMMLEELGYRVLTAAKPSEAIRIAENGEPHIDLLMTDVVMPEMNGRQLSEEIDALQPGTKCLFMSGYTNDVIAHHGVLEDGVHFIQKPFSLQSLATGLRQALEGG